MAKTAKMRQGAFYETQAQLILCQAGLQIVATNFIATGIGEIDIIATPSQQSLLIFVEVRSRKKSQFGTAADSISPTKQGRIYRTAEYFLQQHPEYAEYECRFDVLLFDVMADGVVHEWLVAAF
ncbi:YraN family protein [Moraxella cuniculi]|nr:YraN family protein [Moraxella cuniculi]